MNKNTKNALLAVVVLVALLGTYWGITKKNLEEDTTNLSEDVLIDKKDVKVTQFEMTQNDTQKSYLLKKAQDGSWFAVGQEEKKINLPSVEEILQAATYLKAEQFVSKKTNNLKQFGLDNGATAQITYSDGSVIKIHIGDKTSDGSGYYAMLDEEKKIYIIATKYGAALSYDFSDVRERYTHFIQSEGVEYISLKRKLIIADQEDSQEELIIQFNPNQLTATEYGEKAYILTKGYEEPKTVLTDALIRMIIKPATSIIIKEFVEDGVMDYSKYGLDNPQAHLYMKDRLNNEINLLIGEEDGKGNIYIRYTDENSVYAVEKSVVQSILEVRKYYLIDKYVNVVSVDNVEKIEIQTDDKSTEIATECYIDTVKETKEEAEKTIYKVDGLEVNASDYKDFFAVLTEIRVDAEIGDKEVGTTPVLTTIITTEDKKVLKVNYLEYDDIFYAIEKNGTTEFIINKKNIENLMEAIECLLVKKEIKQS